MNANFSVSSRLHPPFLELGFCLPYRVRISTPVSFNLSFPSHLGSWVSLLPLLVRFRIIVPLAIFIVIVLSVLGLNDWSREWQTIDSLRTSQDTKAMEEKKLGVKRLGRKKWDESEHFVWKDEAKVPCGRHIPSEHKDSLLEYNKYVISDPKQFPALREFVNEGKPVWRTCAGLIFLANKAIEVRWPRIYWRSGLHRSQKFLWWSGENYFGQEAVTAKALLI